MIRDAPSLEAFTKAMQSDTHPRLKKAPPLTVTPPMHSITIHHHFTSHMCVV